MTTTTENRQHLVDLAIRLGGGEAISMSPDDALAVLPMLVRPNRPVRIACEPNPRESTWLVSLADGPGTTGLPPYPPGVRHDARAQTTINSASDALNPRDAIYALISEECDRQAAFWGGAPHDDQHSVDDWLAILQQQIAKAHRMNEDTRGRLVKIAAVCVSAIEAMDRFHARTRPIGQFPSDEGER